MNSGFDELIRAVREDEWAFSQHTATHKPTGRQIWMENIPVLDTNLYPTPAPLTWREKWILSREIRRKAREVHFDAFRRK